MKQPTYEDGTERFTGITDESIMELARAEFANIPDSLKALPGKFIAWVCPRRVDGVIERAWDFAGNSPEAVMVSDGTGSDVPRGTMVMIRPDEGYLHHVNGVELCFCPASALMLLQENA